MVLLMERQPQLISPLLRSLAYLAGVTVCDLGKRCLRQLQDLMGAGDQFASQVVLVTDDCLIPQVKSAAEPDLRRALLEGLTELAEGISLGESLQALVPTLVRWLESDPTDAVISLLAVASSFPKSAEAMGSLRAQYTVLSLITRRSVDADRASRRYLELLRVAEHMARHDNPVNKKRKKSHARGRVEGRSASFFVLNNLHKEVMSELRELVGDKNEWTPSKVGAASAMISCLDGLAQPNNKTGVQELLRPGRGYVRMLCQLYQMQGAHPQVLARVFAALHTLLSTPRDWFPIRYPPDQDMTFAEVQAEVTEGLQFVVPLLQLLGESGSKYAQACRLAGEGAVTVGNRPVSAAQLTSRTMHDLLEQAVLLVQYYCHQAATNPRNKEALEVAARLNDNDRERHLFECLEVPSDRVRLAVVHCLKVVPLSELDNGEVTHLVSMLNDVTNISAGETEKVLGTSFELLTKLVLSNSETGQDFRGNNAENAIQAALSILERNTARDTSFDVNEDDERFILSQSCVGYLRACSTLPQLHVYLRNRDVMDRFNRILRSEDRYSAGFRATLQRRWLTILMRKYDRKAHVYRPSFIECTHAGRAVEYLLQTLVGTHALAPTGVVAPRIVRRMADVLEGCPDPPYDMVHDSVLPATDGSGGGGPAEADSEGEEDEGSGAAMAGRSKGGSSGAAGGGDSSNNPAGDDEDELVEADLGLEEGLDEVPPDTRGYPEQRPRLMAKVNEAVLYFGDEEGEGARERALREEERERDMLPYWEHDVTVPGRVGGVRLESEAETADRVQQHHVFSTSHGLERLVLFMAGGGGGGGGSGVDKDESDGRRAELVDMEAFDRSTLLERLDEFITMFQRKEKDEEAARLRARVAEASKLEEGARVAQEREKSGSDLLLQAFMTSVEDEGGIGSAADAAASVKLVAGGGDSQMEHERSSLVAAGLRVMLALLRHGSTETEAGTKQVLAQPEVMRMLACVCNASSGQPMWFEYNVGPKFLVVVEDVVREDPLGLTTPTSVLPLLDIGSNAVNRMLDAVTERVQRRGLLLPEEERVAMYAARLAATTARQVAMLALPPGLSDEARASGLRFAAGQLLPDALVHHFVELLLYNTRADTDYADLYQVATGNGEESMSLARLIEVPALQLRDSTRVHIVDALVTLLHVDEPRRFDVLELVARTEAEQGTHLRPSLLQDMLTALQQRGFRSALQDYMHEKGLFRGVREDVAKGERAERVVDHAWTELYDGMSGGGAALIVLTTERFYVMKPSSVGSFFGGSSSSSGSGDVASVSPSVSQELSYTSLTRLVLGFGGLRPGTRLHVSVEESPDLSKPPSHFTCVFPRHGVAERIYRQTLELCRARCVADGVDQSKLPPLERDVATEFAVRRLTGPEARGVLYSPVDLVSGASRSRRALLLTDEALWVCKEDMGAWTMPVDWRAIEERERLKYDEHRARMADSAETREERALREAKEEQEFEEAREARLRQRRAVEEGYTSIVRPVGGPHDLTELQGMWCAEMEIASAVIGFGRRKKGEEDSIELDARYSVIFPDDWTRQLWRRCLNAARVENGHDAASFDEETAPPESAISGGGGLFSLW